MSIVNEIFGCNRAICLRFMKLNKSLYFDIPEARISTLASSCLIVSTQSHIISYKWEISAIDFYQ